MNEGGIYWMIIIIYESLPIWITIWCMFAVMCILSYGLLLRFVFHCKNKLSILMKVESYSHKELG
jgi:hypothetical protein